ncbi:MAG TPA: hypothetical protein VFU23_08690 [Gemmatimonadales bacterium]|nr:hypothetical protein [Gemmatimonadales bacterium]
MMRLSTPAKSFLVTTFALLTASSLPAQSPTTLGGYGELHYANPSGRGAPGRVNLARFVLYVAHTFNDRITFRSELEVEDAKVAGGEPGGEVALEQAFLDYRFGESATLRAGLVLLPIGIINETHEPPTFNGVARPLYHEVILPSTWRDIGVGFLGAVPGTSGLAYRVYLVNGIVAEGFDAATGIRGGRQEGRDASFANPAITGRLEYARPGLKVGASAYYGGSANQHPALGTGAFASPVAIIAADARYEIAGFSFRAEAANISVKDAEEINDAFGNGVGSRIAGWYAEGGYDLLRVLTRQNSQRLIGFVRHERLDTQASVPSNVTRDDLLAQRITTFGLTYKPVANVAFKGDYQLRRNRAHDGQDQVVSLGLGYQF